MMRKGFTLIELLIVVAIIAILAAIAVPNFLEAQTRAKVARVKSDHRTLATALEVYMTDYNSYTNDSDNTLGNGGQDGFARLTTPISYITSLPTDPFERLDEPNNAFYYELGSGADNRGWGHLYGAQGLQAIKVQSYIITSSGPDKDDDTDNNDQWPGYGTSTSGGGACRTLTYDATNGTISDGDIVRLGGQLNTGNYYINGQRYGAVN